MRLTSERMRHTVFSVMLVALLLITAIATMGMLDTQYQKPAASPSTGVEHHWVDEASGLMPYTEVSDAEQAAMAAADKAVDSPPWGVVRNADHGYSTPKAQLEKLSKVSDSAPVVVGHELVLSNADHAVRMSVNNDGIATVDEKGNLWVTATPMLPATDHGDLDAAEIAAKTLAASAALEPATHYTGMKPAVAAHEIGFAAEDGTHVIVTVDPKGNVSYSE